MTENLQPMPNDWTRALAVAAHPDDMEFGCAGAVAAWTGSGKQVSYLLVTRGEAGIDGMTPAEAVKVREEEQHASAAVVGVDAVEFLDYADGAVECTPGLRRDIAAAIRRHRPELVVTFNHHDFTYTGKWNSPDHRNTGRAALDAVLDAGNRWIFPDLDAKPWNGVKYVAVAGSIQPTHAVDVTGFLDAAVASVEAHQAYLAGLGIPPGAARGPLEGFAQATGQRFGGRPAIPFELLEF
ncbi:PIG-L deacetylase family protein [Nonomuraea soli]|uniref:LmbE family N-acetylglucosaminyl deacetylase n=1 Tax=Nonomuraea soli TaxID=1032476 RepID=A0A7W0CQG4_9ACTN|nr:PIG-L deacetylase family protein [Nonomuraea soli]MBA2895422.1 LmbE family N-acetylglucosaminyl deacetylase [Nonomuraea soli]